MIELSLLTTKIVQQATFYQYKAIVWWRVESGCADGSTEGLQSGQHDRVAACDGGWSGHVNNASSLCARDWTVCGWNTLDLLQTLRWGDVMTLSGCYALNAAHHDGQCRPCYNQVKTLQLQVHCLSSLPVGRYTYCLKDSVNMSLCMLICEISERFYAYITYSNEALPFE